MEIFLIAGKAGSGKDTILKEVLASNKNLNEIDLNNISEERINESTYKILMFKYKYLNDYKLLDDDFNYFPEKENDKVEIKVKNIVKKNKKVIFTGNFEFPQTVAEGYIILEVTDITDRLKIFAEDKSRGSDYGD